MKELPGPDGPIRYRRDSLGYPSIEAVDRAAGMYALGYLHAKDRLVQITIGSLAAEGRLMSAFGDAPIARLIDYAVRAAGLFHDAQDQVERIASESRQLLDAYCNGFNAAVSRRRRPLPLQVLGVPPLHCTPASMLAFYGFFTYFGLTMMQLSTELLVAELGARGAPQRLFDRLLGAHGRGLCVEDLRELRIPPELSFFGNACFGSPIAASNAFAVAGARSRSGGALLMGEFHLDVSRLPPLLYAAHIAFDDGNFLSGMTIPGLSWFAAGRTRHVGWSYTFAHADNVDFLVERVDAGRYLVGEEYRPLRQRAEHIRIKGKPGERWVFHDHEYGTVLGDVSGKADLPCLRVTGRSETYRAFSAGARVLDCRTVEDLMDVQREIRSVSLEAVLVDARGDIASIVTGEVDQRPADWTGAYPRRGWDLQDRSPSPLAESERPLSLRPDSGAIVSANQGGHGPHREKWCNYPEPPYRFRRIGELLSQTYQHDLRSLVRISYDPFDKSAEQLLPVWLPLLDDHPLVAKLSAWLREQSDRQLMRLFHKLHEEVTIAILAEDLGEDDARQMRQWSALSFYQHELDKLLALEAPERLARDDLRRLLQIAWPKALAGYLHHDVPVRLRLKHSVTQGRTPAVLGFDSKPIELPGTPVTPFQCRRISVGGHEVVYAPAFHLTFDMSRPQAYYNMPGGASESRLGAGYGKGVQDWLSGRLIPLGGALVPALKA